MLDFTDLDKLVDLVREETTIRSVSLAVSEVNPPGVWLNLTGFAQDHLEGTTFDLVAYLIVGDLDPRRAMTELETLWNELQPLVDDLGGPTGRTRALSLVMAEGPPLPALSVPFSLTTTPDEE